MRSTFKILFYINKQKIRTDNTVTILCRMSVDGKSTVISTGINCNIEDWSSEKGTINSERGSNEINAFRQQVERTYERILKDQKTISSELLKNALVGINSIPTNLIDAGKIEMERLRIRSKEINSTSTYRDSRSMQANLIEYLNSIGLENIEFNDITEEFGESFKIYLKSVQNRANSYINRALCWLNRLIYIAVDQNLLRFNPLEDVKYEKKEQTKHKYISKSDLKSIMETPMIDKPLELARRAFIFSCFTGLAYVDIHRLYPQHISKTSKGKLYIRKKRVKTNVEAFIPLHPIAEQIISLYNTTDNSIPIFPLPKSRSIWYEINQIGIIMGFKDNLSYHQGRHSFGTLAISSGLSIESIAKMMGHSNISTTQGYAQVTEQKISDEMDKLMERRESMQNEITKK